jgi:peptidoglycan/xylan/chitin deacetylase (PgdA/CDA1 family)
VLLYHRVADLAADPQRLSVKPEKFAAHLELVRKKCTPLSLESLVHRANHGSLPEHAVAITFDDGFADNFLNAKPIAERYDVPVTVFVTAGQVGAEREFWWDELERILLGEPVLPERLAITVGDRNLSWDLTPDGTASHLYDNWDVQCAGNPTPRHAAYRSLCDAMRPLSEPKQRGILEQLRFWSGVNAMHRESHLALTPDQLIMLDKSQRFTIGAHTRSHAHLASLSAAEQDSEITGSKTLLEKILGHQVATFAYPFGARGDYNGASIDAVRRAGFDLACANFPGRVWRRSDRFQLPRLLVRDWDGETFERWLDDWLR